jgi:hypothetical protein
VTDEHAVSYKVLAPGAPVVTSDGRPAGTVARVLENRAEHIFDGLDLETPHGPRFVDAPEVARITNVKVELAIDDAALAALPERDPKGAPEFRAAKGRRFGSLWRRR